MVTSRPPDDRVRIDAERWVLRLADASFDDWDGFTAWLEADPAHNDAYQAALDRDAEIDTWFAAAPANPPAVRTPRSRIPRWGYVGGAIAAAIVAVVGIGEIGGDAQPYAIETAAGERRSIALADGSRIDLNGGSRLMLDRADARYALLERGEALFTVRHDEADPFRVDAGPSELIDVGTVFNVVRTDGETRVEVSEGAVVYNPDGEAVRIGPGRALIAGDDASRVRLTAIEPLAVGAWSSRRLIYSAATIDEVAADLSRNLGVAIAVDAAPGEAFTGTLTLDGPPGTVIARAAPLLGVAARPKGGGWVLTSNDRDRP